RAIAVPPVQREQARLAGAQPRRLLLEYVVHAHAGGARTLVQFGWHRRVGEPREDVADARLTRLEAEQPRHDPVFDDAAHPLDLLLAVAEQDVAVARAHDDHHRPRLGHRRGRSGDVRVDVRHRDRRPGQETGPRGGAVAETARTTADRDDLP